MLERFRKLADRAGLHEHVLLVVLLILAAGVVLFLFIAEQVEHGSTLRFDTAILRSLRRPDAPAIPRGPVWLQDVARDVTALGGVTVLTLVTCAVAGYLALVRKYAGTLLVVVAALGALALSSSLKHLIARARPDIVPHLHQVYTYSFPSGHSMMSSAIYLTLGSLLARLVPDHRVKLYFILISLFLTFVIGLSRVYLGVHYPTDVLAGWTAGLGWALLCWLAARLLQKRGAVETDRANTGTRICTNEDTNLHE